MREKNLMSMALVGLCLVIAMPMIASPAAAAPPNLDNLWTFCYVVEERVANMLTFAPGPPKCSA